MCIIIGRATQGENHSLTIDNIRATDVGIYVCRLRLFNQGVDHHPTGTRVRLHVNSECIDCHNLQTCVCVAIPKLIETPSDSVYRTIGQSMTLNCVAGAQPQPKIRWLKDGVEVHTGDVYEIRSEQQQSGGKQATTSIIRSTLIVLRLEQQHNGDYSCVASNQLGTDKHTTTVHFTSMFTFTNGYYVYRVFLYSITNI
jgi:hypothetical protein